MYIVFSDLDGTLLDHNTYSYEKSQEGMELIKTKGGSLVLVSSKTFDEMSLLHAELSLDSPLIFENGSGIAYFNSGQWDIEIHGKGIDALEEYVAIVEQATENKLTLITDMSDEKLSAMTGLSHERAALSKKRRATLPFIFTDNVNLDVDDLRALNKKIHTYDITVTRGGRFYHLIPGGSNKGVAVKKVTEYYSSTNAGVQTIAFGDSENDIPMFAAVDKGYIVKKHDGSVLKLDLKHVTYTEAIGPEGFTEGIKKYFGVY